MDLCSFTLRYGSFDSNAYLMLIKRYINNILVISIIQALRLLFLKVLWPTAVQCSFIPCDITGLVKGNSLYSLRLCVKLTLALVNQCVLYILWYLCVIYRTQDRKLVCMTYNCRLAWVTRTRDVFGAGCYLEVQRFHL